MIRRNDSNLPQCSRDKNQNGNCKRIVRVTTLTLLVRAICPRQLISRSGFFVSELVRRIDPKGRCVSAYFNEELSRPHSLDIHIGTLAVRFQTWNERDFETAELIGLFFSGFRCA